MNFADSNDDVFNRLAFLALNAILVLMVLFGLVLLVGAINFARAGGHPGFVTIVVLCACFVGGAGLALLYRTHFMARIIAAREAAIVERYPGQPWMLNPDWASGQINDPQFGRVIFLVIFIVGWVGGIAFVGFVNFNKILPELQASPGAWVAAAFFALITIMAINMAIKFASSWLRIGNGLLRLETLPGRIGGQFKAKLETRLRHRPASGLEADLTCLRRLPATGRRPAQNEEETLWWQRVTIPAAQMRLTRQGMVISVVFEIDDDLPESGETVDWKLRISSGGGAEQFLLFEWVVPIYRKPQKRF